MSTRPSEIAKVGGYDPKIIRIAFPVRENRAELVKSNEYQYIEQISPDVAQLISDDIRAYKEASPQLYALSDMDNMDKHRMLVPSITSRSHLIVSIREDQEDNPPPAQPGAFFKIAG
jgi:hypothetical protein